MPSVNIGYCRHIQMNEAATVLRASCGSSVTSLHFFCVPSAIITLQSAIHRLVAQHITSGGGVGAAVGVAVGAGVGLRRLLVGGGGGGGSRRLLVAQLPPLLRRLAQPDE